ncbi:DUF998 domain-containing protein [Roseovarius pelagicus]|uniref:DUF998 domain-containing protein n=1 Tax=Roseovarius pelagicus TaxID=2980108 RepID=A0ABY6D789_9RHOB|nr:DUF998 domain-containing protein [Roseovarius pelagicus]UXX81953.1 DUF998 domain-containing protein [Roseovarius pelagicus]
MRRDHINLSRDCREPWLLIVLGVGGIAGCAALIFGTLIGPYYVPDHDWIADTISDLAAGDSEIIMDVALYGFAAGLFAAALAAAHAHPGGAAWSAGIVALAILAAIVIVVGARNEYGDNDSEGIVIHSYLVYGLGFFFLVAPLCMAAGAGTRSHGIKWALLGLAAVWALAAPVFFLLPTGIDGLYERGLGLIACAMTAVLCLHFIAIGHSGLRRRDAR